MCVRNLKRRSLSVPPSWSPEFLQKETRFIVDSSFSSAWVREEACPVSEGFYSSVSPHFSQLWPNVCPN